MQSLVLCVFKLELAGIKHVLQPLSFRILVLTAGLLDPGLFFALFLLLLLLLLLLCFVCGVLLLLLFCCFFLFFVSACVEGC